MTALISAREKAALILQRIIQDGAYNNIALRDLNGFSENDRYFITELVNGSLRNKIFIDRVISSYSHVKITKIKPLLLNILRISVYQIYFCERVPHFALCDEAVFVAKKHYPAFSGFTNALLRTIIRNKDKNILPEYGTYHFLEAKYSHPKELLQSINFTSFEQAEQFCIVNNTAPKVTLCTNILKTTRDELVERLESEGVNVEKSAYNDVALYVSKANIPMLSSYKDGWFHVVDESSMLAARCLGVRNGSMVLDICAAPGGKTFLIAQNNPDGEIYAHDISAKKIDLLIKEAKRLGIKNINASPADARVFNSEYENKFDHILADAPCSGLGIIRKKPDIRYNKTIETIDTLSGIQECILMTVRRYLKPSGTLVYSTCTLTDRENLENFNKLREYLQPVDLTKKEIIPKEISSYCSDTASEGFIQIMPSVNNDGFFIGVVQSPCCI